MGRRSQSAPVFPLLCSDDWQSIVDEGVDSVEVKILLGPGPDAAAAALTGRTTSRWRLRRVYLLDTPDLDFAHAGVEMRLRRRARGRHDLTVRARRRHGGTRRPQPPGARVEFDILPGAVWHTVELRRDVDASLAEAVAEGIAFPQELLTPDQEEWMRAAAEDLSAAALASTLVVHGPLRVSRVGVPGSRFRVARAHLEHCRYPSGRELVEFSTRCRPESAGRVAEEVLRFLASQGVAPSGSHDTKTAIWLDELARAVPTSRS